MFFSLFPASCFTAGDVAMACGIRSAGESCILTSQYPQGLAAWQSGVQRAPFSVDRSVPPESKSKRSKVSVHGSFMSMRWEKIHPGSSSHKYLVHQASLRSIAEFPRSRLRLVRAYHDEQTYIYKQFPFILYKVFANNWVCIIVNY